MWNVDRHLFFLLYFRAENASSMPSFMAYFLLPRLFLASAIQLDFSVLISEKFYFPSSSTTVPGVSFTAILLTNSGNTLEISSWFYLLFMLHLIQSSLISRISNTINSNDLFTSFWFIWVFSRYIFVFSEGISGYHVGYHVLKVLRAGGWSKPRTHDNNDEIVIVMMMKHKWKYLCDFELMCQSLFSSVFAAKFSGQQQIMTFKCS